MQWQRCMVLGIGVTVLLFVLAGCSSNPMTSTQTISGADNAGGDAGAPGAEPVDQSGKTGGVDTTPSISNDKHAQDADKATEVGPPNGP